MARAAVAYGDNFCTEAFLYHLGRGDPRHNFSPSFYGTYLDARVSERSGRLKGGVAGTASRVAGKLAHVAPQILVVASVGVKYASDLPLCFFAQTLGFVAFNSVSTRGTSCGTFVWRRWRFRNGTGSRDSKSSTRRRLGSRTFARSRCGSSRRCCGWQSRTSWSFAASQSSSSFGSPAVAFTGANA